MGTRLAEEPTGQRLAYGVAIDLSDGFRQRNGFRASMDTVLCIGAILDAAGAADRFQALVGIHRSRGMHVEKAYLADDGRADEVAVGINLRTNLQAYAASDAPGKRVGFLLRFGSHLWTFAHIVGAINGDPSLHALQILKHDVAIHGQIADHGELGHGLNSDGLIKMIDKSRAGHAGFAVNYHRAGAADFF